ncbi:MAG: 8-oxo-dGTP diphosphatase [Chloroflexota bacterium]
MQPLIQATELFLIDEARNRVLLGHKKSGIGEGKILGIGGKVEEGESPEAATIREMWEETTLRVALADLIKVGEVTFLFPHKPQWNMTVHNYVATRWTGTPTETDEMAPEWFPLANLPLNRMWDDAQYWLQATLGGQFVVGEFTFYQDNETVAENKIEFGGRWA